MPHIESDGVRIYYEDTGVGTPIIFAHEFLADCRHWEVQVRAFSRSYRCITFNARGYEPSDVPDDPQAYAYPKHVHDIKQLMFELGIGKAFVVGQSMGAYSALQFGLACPEMAMGLVLAGVGTGAPRQIHEQFKADSAAMSRRIEKEGMLVLARQMSLSATRIQLHNKDPRGWEEFVRFLGEHSTKGSAMALRHYQGARPSLYDFETQLAALEVPVLLALGDEDDPCLDVNVFLKRTLPASGLWVCPKTGHGINLEESAAFNAACQSFFNAVELGRWSMRDPRARSAGAFAELVRPHAAESNDAKRT